nr:ATP-binding protein [Pseudenhygromyxa sp. WMMC2535]
MGDRRRIWIAAGTCGLVFAGLSLVQLSGLLQLPGEAKPAPGPIAANVLWLSLLRTSAAIGFVAILSAYLNRQLLSSVSDLGNLRNLTENIVRSLTSGLLTVDPRRRVVFANPTARELLGVAGELPGQTCDALIPGLSAHLDDSGGFRNRFELDITRADDNREVHLGLSCSPLLDERGGFLGHVVTFQDVSKLREMERVVRRNERLAALGGLAASVAHEVRNPLAAIAGCAELLESETQNEEDQRLIRVIRRESARLNTIVSELLDYTRPRQLMRTPTDIAKLVRELVDGLRADPNLAEIEFILDLPEPEPEPSTTADIDAAQLTQVLWNLARNGAQAMDQVGKLELGVIGRSDAVSLMVRDHGRGIPSENLERIFEPFFSTKEGGSGIGLALVHRIIEDHGGDIQVFSVVGEGTSFVLTLPRKEPTLG